jgi:hypothetical protein
MARALHGFGLGLKVDECVESPIVPAVNEGRAPCHDPASDMDVVKSGNDGDGDSFLVYLAHRENKEVAREQPAFGAAIDAGAERASFRKRDCLLDIELRSPRKFGSACPMDAQHSMQLEKLSELYGCSFRSFEYTRGKQPHDRLPAIAASRIAWRKLQATKRPHEKIRILLDKALLPIHSLVSPDTMRTGSVSVSSAAG